MNGVDDDQLGAAFLYLSVDVFERGFAEYEEVVVGRCAESGCQAVGSKFQLVFAFFAADVENAQGQAHDGL